MKKADLLRRIIIVMIAALFLAGTVTACAENTGGKAKAESFRTVGNIVTFGRYEQDNDLSNGPEAIEWIVLDVVDGENPRALLLSKYGLDAKQYNHRYEPITWEECSLRRWLNNEFLKTAFDAKEQDAILLTEVDNSPEQGYIEWADVVSGNDTQDMVFLLSCAEAKKYLDVTPENKQNIKARVAPTPYAIAQSAWENNKYLTADGEPAGRWWLRSPGRYEYRAAHVIGNGSLQNSHVSAAADHYGGGVARPAIWVDLNADIF
jgi:hypothetical protein